MLKTYKELQAINSFSGEKTSIIFDLYWNFACERQNIFINKKNGTPWPWTKDPILQKYKFTNAYRASDRVSQFLINNIIYTNNNYREEDILFRILFFKIFNKIETWNKVYENFGDIIYNKKNFSNYCDYFDYLLKKNEHIYSAAYIMPSGNTAFGYKNKHKNYLALLKYIFNDNITKKVLAAKSLKEIYQILLSYPMIGPFLAFQYSIDINYSELCNFDEMSFVIAGPGAIRGIKKCFPYTKKHPEEIIEMVAENQDEEFKKRNLIFKRIGNRPLQLIDCQNLFCEIDKYSRISNPELSVKNNRIKQKYKPFNNAPIKYKYPPKWHINIT